MGWYLEALVNFADFSGRASRSEYWWFYFFNLFIVSALAILTVAARLPELVFLVYLVAMIIPSVSVSVRRLHDTNRSGWWLLLSLIPFGGFVLLFFYIIPGTPGPNNCGPEFRTTSPSARKVASRNAHVEEELMRLYQLQKNGAMSLEEYQARRKALLSHI
jgi:uncharacterized membrane protein YhaH (DUF805 family)